MLYTLSCRAIPRKTLWKSRHERSGSSANALPYMWRVDELGKPQHELSGIRGELMGGGIKEFLDLWDN